MERFKMNIINCIIQYFNRADKAVINDNKMNVKKINNYKVFVQAVKKFNKSNKKTKDYEKICLIAKKLTKNELNKYFRKNHELKIMECLIRNEIIVKKNIYVYNLYDGEAYDIIKPVKKTILLRNKFMFVYAFLNIVVFKLLNVNFMDDVDCFDNLNKKNNIFKNFIFSDFHMIVLKFKYSSDCFLKSFKYVNYYTKHTELLLKSPTILYLKIYGYKKRNRYLKGYKKN